jgi:hypothetical protein
MTPHNYEIVDCGAFCEFIFFASHPRICFGTFSTVSPVINETPPFAFDADFNQISLVLAKCRVARNPRF